MDNTPSNEPPAGELRSLAETQPGEVIAHLPHLARLAEFSEGATADKASEALTLVTDTETTAAASRVRSYVDRLMDTPENDRSPADYRALSRLAIHVPDPVVNHGRWVVDIFGSGDEDTRRALLGAIATVAAENPAIVANVASELQELFPLEEAFERYFLLETIRHASRETAADFVPIVDDLIAIATGSVIQEAEAAIEALFWITIVEPQNVDEDRVIETFCLVADDGPSSIQRLVVQQVGRWFRSGRSRPRPLLDLLLGGLDAESEIVRRQTALEWYRLLEVDPDVLESFPDVDETTVSDRLQTLNERFDIAARVDGGDRVTERLVNLGGV